MTFSQPFAFPELEPATEIVTVGASPRTRAEDIIRRAHQEAERIAAEAAERGRREGHAAGVARAREELEPLLAAVEATAGALDQLRASVLAEAERQAVELAIALADKIVST